MSFVAALATLGETAAMTAALGEGALAAGTAANTIGAGMLMGSTMGAAGSALTGGDVGQGAGLGALTGGIGGAASAGLGVLAGSGGTAMGTEGLANAAGNALPTAEGVANPALSAPLSEGITNQSLGNVSNFLGDSGYQTPVSNTAPQALGANPVGGLQSEINAISPQFNTINSGVTSAGIAPQTTEPSMLNKIGNFAQAHPSITAGGISMLATPLVNGMISSSSPTTPKIQYPNIDPNKFRYSQPQWSVYRPSYAAGGLTDLDGFASQAQNVEQGMPAQMQGGIGTLQVPNPKEVADPTGYTGESAQAMAEGGIADLGGYTNGGLLQGDGDGVSDDIHGTIRDKAPVRLASGEFVVPARTVSELGNGDTAAGAKRLDQMVKNINAGRSKTLKGKDYAKDTKAYKHLPA